MKLTPEQIASFNAYQQSGVFHPFTCGGSVGEGVAEHPDGEGILVATEDGLRCPYCDYTQNWCHDWMLDWSWKQYDILDGLRGVSE